MLVETVITRPRVNSVSKVTSAHEELKPKLFSFESARNDPFAT